MPLAKEMPPLEYLNECFELRDEGLLFWRVRPLEHFSEVNGYRRCNGRFAGKEAGYIHSITSYKRVRLPSYGLILQHRIVYSMYHETALDVALYIDHINGNKLDNRPENLRLVSQLENTRNARMSIHNKSGVNGVYWQNSRNNWRATIKIHNKSLDLGTFHTIEEAAAARKAADIKYGFSERHGEPL